MSCQELARSAFKALRFHLEEQVEHWERKFDIKTSLKVRCLHRVTPRSEASYFV